MSEVVLVYVTCPSEETAHEIGRAMVEKQHAACANIIPGMKSIYRWQGQIESANETILILKTVKHNWSALFDAVKAMHPYDVPCIVALPVEGGHKPYLEWIGQSVITLP